MKARATVLWEPGEPWSVEGIDLDGPRSIGGREGSGLVDRVGAGVAELEPGDHVVLGFIPMCGQRSRLMCVVGIFTEHTIINQAACVKITPAARSEKAVLERCGITTGSGRLRGQGDRGRLRRDSGYGRCRQAGTQSVVVVELLAFKRVEAMRFGAAHTVETVVQARVLLHGPTWRAMAGVVVITIDKMAERHLAPTMALKGEGRICVPVSDGDPAETAVDLSIDKQEDHLLLVRKRESKIGYPSIASERMKGADPFG